MDSEQRIGGIASHGWGRGCVDVKPTDPSLGAWRLVLSSPDQGLLSVYSYELIYWYMDSTGVLVKSQKFIAMSHEVDWLTYTMARGC